MIMSISLPQLNKILIFLIIFITNSFAQDEIKTGQLSISLNSPGIVYLNSEFLTNESISNLNLKSGKYILSFYNSESRNWNERGYQSEINIYPNDELIIEIPNTKLIYINTIPYGGDIFQSNQLLGKSPIFVNSKNINFEENINIVKTGYSPLMFIPNANKTEYFFKLNPESVSNEITFASPVLDNSQTTWFKEGFVVLSVISSWAAFYFKREADQNYSKYLSSGNPAKIEKYYNATQRYDTFSDISIGVSLGALSTYMYFLIFD